MKRLLSDVFQSVFQRAFEKLVVRHSAIRTCAVGKPDTTICGIRSLDLAFDFAGHARKTSKGLGTRLDRIGLGAPSAVKHPTLDANYTKHKSYVTLRWSFAESAGLPSVRECVHCEFLNFIWACLKYTSHNVTSRTAKYITRWEEQTATKSTVTVMDEELREKTQL